MDKRAIKVLFNTFWSSDGWKPDTQRGLSPEDFAYAKSKHMMFDPVQLDHTQALELLSKSIKKLDRRLVADAFLASLTSRRFDWRSALGSYAVFQHIPAHSPSGVEGRCNICGFYLNECEHDLNVLNFERFKWGGIRHDQLIYAAMDLDLFLEYAPPIPTTEDIQIFRSVISAIANSPTNVGSAALHSHFAKVLKSNKAERDIFIAILGFCGILGTPEHPGFSDSFVPVIQRELPDRHFVDMSYPACWWRGEVGINQSRLQEYFGHVL